MVPLLINAFRLPVNSGCEVKANPLIFSRGSFKTRANADSFRQRDRPEKW